MSLQEEFDKLEDRSKTITVGSVSIKPYIPTYTYPPVTFDELLKMPPRMFTTIKMDNSDHYLGHFGSVDEIKNELRNKIKLFFVALEDLENE